MRHLMAWATIVTGICMVAGCKGKSAQDALEGAQGPVSKDSAMMASSDNSDNTPATFHPNGRGQEKAAPAPGSFSENGRYVVQVRVFETRVHADALVSKLSAAGFPAYVAVVENPTPDLPGTYYRVRIGSFDSREEAQAFAEGSLKPQGYDSWVDTKANDHMGTGSGETSKSDTGTAAASPTPAPVAPAPSPREPHHRHTRISASGSLTVPNSSLMRNDNTPAFSGHVGLDVPPPPPPIIAPAFAQPSSSQTSSQAASSRSRAPSNATNATNAPAARPPVAQPATPPETQPVESESNAAESAAAPGASAPAPVSAPEVKMGAGLTAPDGSEPTPQLDTNAPPEAPAPAAGKDTMQSPFAREGYYRPTDSSTPPPATSVPDGDAADTANNSRRTLPTW